MKKWLDDDMCTACGACRNICPQNAISLKWNERGFAIPHIDESKCVDCGLCEARCPVRGKLISQKPFCPENSWTPKVYAAWSKDEEIRKNSSSGGIFSEIAKVVLAKHGYVCGAVFNDEQMVEHAIVSDEEGLVKVRQSKYVQSDIGIIFREILLLLKKNHLVLFCGSACQVAGLYAFLGRNYDNLITTDFICRGANSPMIYKKWLESLEMEYNSKATNVCFRNKKNGWKNFMTRVEFENGEVYTENHFKDIYMKSFLERNLFIRPSCSNCQFKGMPRVSDITLADFWGVVKELDSNKGTSLLFVNSQKGQHYFDKMIPQIEYQERTYAEAAKGNTSLEKSVVPGEYVNYFFDSITNGVDFKSAFDEITEKIYEKQPLISILLVVEDVTTLNKRIADIRQQSYGNREVIVVDVTEDDRAFHLFEANNKGKLVLKYVNCHGMNLYEALNNGMAEAQGQYVHVLKEGEKLYDNDVYKKSMDILVETGADVLCAAYIKNDGEPETEIGTMGYNGEGNAYSLLKYVFEVDQENKNIQYGGKICNRIFKKEKLQIDGNLIPFRPELDILAERRWQLDCSFLWNSVVYVSEPMLVSSDKKRVEDSLRTMNLTQFLNAVETLIADSEKYGERVFKIVCETCLLCEMRLAAYAYVRQWHSLYRRLELHIMGMYEDFLCGREALDYSLKATSRIERFYVDCQNLTKQKNTVLAKYEQAAKDIGWLKEQCEILKEQRRNFNKNIGDLNQLLDKEREDLKSLELEHNTAQIKLENFEQSNATLEKDKKWLKNQLEIKNQKIDLLEENVAQEKTKNEQLSTRCADAEKDKMWLKSQNDVKKKKIESLEDVNKALKQKIQELEKMQQEMREEISIHLKDKQELNEKVDALNQKKHDLKQHIDDMNKKQKKMNWRKA